MKDWKIMSIVCSLTFLFGILFSLLADVSFGFLYPTLILILIGLIVSQNLLFKTFLTCFALLLGLTIGLHAKQNKEFDFSLLDNVNIIYGYVDGLKDVKDNHIRVPFRLKDSSFRGLLKTSSYTNIPYGSYIKIEGFAREVEPFVTQRGRLFRYDKYLEKDDIFFTISSEKVDIIGSDNGFYAKLFSLRDKYVDILNSALPQPHAALATGITIGEKSSLGKMWEDIFRSVGIIHIVVLSGYNVTIIAETVSRALRRRRVLGIYLSILFIITFAIFTGASATIIRASIMAILFLLARLFLRKGDGMLFLLFAGLVMVALNPYILLYDPSFHLSFLATFGLLLFLPDEDKMDFSFWKIIKYILIATLITQIFVLPYLLLTSGEISVVGLVTNSLILPVIPFAMLVSFLLFLIGIISLPIVSIFSPIVYVILGYILLVSERLSEVPFASVEIPQTLPSFLILSLIYILMSLLLGILKRNKV